MKSQKDNKGTELRYKEITEKYENGVKSAAEIARQTNVPTRTVQRLLGLWKAGALAEDLKKIGRPPKITPQNHSFLASEISKNPAISSRELQIRLLMKKGIQVQVTTFFNIRWSIRRFVTIFKVLTTRAPYLEQFLCSHRSKWTIA